MPDVYISCAPKDTATAHHIQKELESKGISCCISNSYHTSGIASSKTISFEILRSKIFVILVSRDSLSSSIVKNELFLATKADRSIFPVRLDNTPLNDTFLFYLGTRQWITARRRLPAASRELCDVIDRELRHEPSQSRINSEDQENNYFNEDKRLIIRMLICVILCLVFLIVSAISFALLRKTDVDLYWDIDSKLSLIVVAALFLIAAPSFGGYITFLRTVLEKIWDAVRGK